MKYELAHYGIVSKYLDISVELNGRTINGSMINPSPRLGQTQGYDSAAYGRYARPGNFDPSMNVARPNNDQLSKSNPLVLQPNCSLVSVESTLQANDRTQLKAAAVLTVLDSPAKEGNFRRPYSGTDKTIRFNKEQLDHSLLASLKPLATSSKGNLCVIKSSTFTNPLLIKL